MRARKIYESPDTVSLPNLEYNKYGEDINSDEDLSPYYGDSDAHPFWIEGGEVVLGKASSTHPFISRSESFEGRLWKDRKIISFWKYPDVDQFIDIIDQLSNKLKKIYRESFDILNDPDWKVEVLPDRKWSDSDKGDFKTQLIPVMDYVGSEQRSEEDLAQNHIKSPLLKTKKYIPGFGSSSPRYRANRIWQMAAPIGESKIVREDLRFERGQDPKSAIGLGIEGAISRIKKEIGWQIKNSAFDGPGSLHFRSKDLYEIWKSGASLERSAIKKILEEFLSGKKKWRDNFQRFDIFEMLNETGLLWDPKYMFPTPNNASMIWRIDVNKFYEFVYEYWTPNQLYSAGINMEDPEILKKAIKLGATNLHIGGTTPFVIAAERGDYDLMKDLLNKSPNSPGESSREAKRYKDKFNEQDISNAPIKIAAKRGFFNIVRLLMNDPRVDPSAANNFALRWSFHEGHEEVARLLLKDPRVRNKVDLLPKTKLDELKERGLLESVNFIRGKDPKSTMKIGVSSDELKVYRCGHCGNITDEYGYIIPEGDPEYQRSVDIINKMDDKSTVRTFCDECQYEQEMEAQAEEERRREEEEQERWRWDQEDDERY